MENRFTPDGDGARAVLPTRLRARASELTVDMWHGRCVGAVRVFGVVVVVFVAVRGWLCVCVEGGGEVVAGDGVRIVRGGQCDRVSVVKKWTCPAIWRSWRSLAWGKQAFLRPARHPECGPRTVIMSVRGGMGLGFRV